MDLHMWICMTHTHAYVNQSNLDQFVWNSPEGCTAALSKIGEIFMWIYLTGQFHRASVSSEVPNKSPFFSFFTMKVNRYLITVGDMNVFSHFFVYYIINPQCKQSWNEIKHIKREGVPKYSAYNIHINIIIYVLISICSGGHLEIKDVAIRKYFVLFLYKNLIKKVDHTQAIRPS